MSLSFARFRRQLAALTGIALEADKQYLAESRLGPVMRAHALTDMKELADALDHAANGRLGSMAASVIEARNGACAVRDRLDPALSQRAHERRDHFALIREVIDAMTTNETLFFRDRTPFETFRETILPELMASHAHSRRLRFWCAACSTGQEAYSLAMTLDQDVKALRGWSVEILATDVSSSAVEAARCGTYSQFEVQRGLSTGQLLRYFHRQEETWRVNEHMRARINFRDFNLLSDFSDLGTFDVIFCRNVLMYFDPDVKRDVLQRLSLALNDGGYLALGASESVGDSGALFTQVSPDGFWRSRRRPAPQLRLA